MRLLLDTHVLLWSLGAPQRLGQEARAAITDPNNEVMFSAASIWEIAIKSTLKKADFRVTPGEVVKAALESGFVELPVRSAAAAHVATLPMHHHDPFDRLLIAQALTEPATFLTADAQLMAYSQLVQRISKSLRRPLQLKNVGPRTRSNVGKYRISGRGRYDLLEVGTCNLQKKQIFSTFL